MQQLRARFTEHSKRVEIAAARLQSVTVAPHWLETRALRRHLPVVRECLGEACSACQQLLSAVDRLPLERARHEGGRRATCERLDATRCCFCRRFRRATSLASRSIGACAFEPTESDTRAEQLVTGFARAARTNERPQSVSSARRHFLLLAGRLLAACRMDLRSAAARRRRRRRRRWQRR